MSPQTETPANAAQRTKATTHHRRRLAGAALLVILGVAAVEWIAAARAYQTTLPSSAWRALEQRLAELHSASSEGGRTPPLILLADPWLGPRARLEIEALRDPASVAPHDLYGVRDLTIIARDDDPWTPWLREAWGDRPLPAVARVDRLGPFVLHHISAPEADELLLDLVELSQGEPDKIQLRDRFGRCRRKKGSKGGWSCTLGKVTVAYAEVAYRPRRCLRFDVGDGAQITLKLAGVELGDRLRGHLGFSDFNARIRSDAPALVEVRIDGRPLASLTISDRQGWAAFELMTPPGRHDLEMTVTPTLTGTWGERGYERRPSHLPCLELRALRSRGALP